MKTTSGVELFGRSMEPVLDDEDRPVSLTPSEEVYGSDIVADALSALDIGFVAFRPDADFAGLHDSLINRNGNRRPRLLPCFDSDHALDIALGYTRASGAPMVVGCSDTTASLPRLRIFAEHYQSLFVLTANTLSVHEDPGPFKAHFHVQNYLDIQKVIYDAYWTCVAEPCGPVRVSLSPHVIMDAVADKLPHKRMMRLYKPQRHSGIGAEKCKEIAEILQEANSLLILAGQLGHSVEEWASLAAFAEGHGARVVTAFGNRAVFDCRHPLHVGEIGGTGEVAARAAFEAADVVIALNWSEWGRLSNPGTTRRRSFLIDVGVVSGRGGDHSRLVKGDADLPDVVINATPAVFLRELQTVLGVQPIIDQQARRAASSRSSSLTHDEITPDGLIAALQQAIGLQPATLAHLPIDWRGPPWPASEPLDALGSITVGGLGAAVGATLALKEAGRVVIAVLNGVDFIAEATRLWTAAHFELPLLVVVLNGASIPSAERRQARIARSRNRERRNAVIGTGFQSPAIRIADIARGYAGACYAPVSKSSDLPGALAEALEQVRNGQVAVLEVHLARTMRQEEETH